jgi:hypothetical protein
MGMFPVPFPLGSIGAVALSPDVVQQYGLQPGQSFNVQVAGGETMTFVYADNTASNLTGRIDVYDDWW